MVGVASHVIEGHVSRGFEAVRDAFEENFARRGELGGACSVYQHGEKVVELWGGIRNKQTGEPWERDTMVVLHSATKGLAAMTLASRTPAGGWITRSAWRRTGPNSRKTASRRSPCASCSRIRPACSLLTNRSTGAWWRTWIGWRPCMARHRPAWEPGTRQAYHGLTLGFYEGELMRRVDPLHRSLGQFFQDEIATPLGEDFYIRLPEEIPNARLATLSSPGLLEMLVGFRPVRLMVEGLNRHSNISRALAVNPGTSVYLDESTRVRAQSGGAGRRRRRHGARR